MRQVQYKTLQESTKGHQENLNRFQLLRTEDHLGPTHCWKHNWKSMISYQMLWVKVFNKVIENSEKSRPAESNTMNIKSILLFWVWCSNIKVGIQAVFNALCPVSIVGLQLSRYCSQLLGKVVGLTLQCSYHNPMLPPRGKAAMVLGDHLSVNNCLFFQLDKW